MAGAKQASLNGHHVLAPMEIAHLRLNKLCR